jgi:hypothetical protein
MILDDVVAAVKIYVIGACYEHNRQVVHFTHFTTDPFTNCGNWVESVFQQALLSVTKNKFPDGGNSDFEAEIMLKTRLLFQRLLPGK